MRKLFSSHRLNLGSHHSCGPLALPCTAKAIQSLLVAQPCLAFVCQETNPKVLWELFPFHMEAILVLGPHESSQDSSHLSWDSVFNGMLLFQICTGSRNHCQEHIPFTGPLPPSSSPLPQNSSLALGLLCFNQMFYLHLSFYGIFLI